MFKLKGKAGVGTGRKTISVKKIKKSSKKACII